MDLKETLQFYRKRQGLSQIELAEALNVSRQTVSKWETGTALPAAEHLLALSKLYNVPVDALLNGETAELLPAEDILAPARALPEPHTLSRPRQLLLRIVGVVVLFDLLVFLLEFYLGNLTGGGSMFCPLLRLLGCCLIGLTFAWWNREQSFDRKAVRLIGLAALAAGVYVFLMPVPLLWRLYDFVTWMGPYQDELRPTNPVSFFLGWTLFDEYAFASHMFLIAFFQLGRLGFSRKAAPAPQAVQQV